MTRIDQPLTREAVELEARKAVTEQWRRHLVWRQNGVCAKCETAPLVWEGLDHVILEFDHIIPLELGGLHSLDNLQALCIPCHKAKTRDDIKRIRKAQRLERDASPETRRRTKNPIRSRGFQRADDLKDRP